MRILYVTHNSSLRSTTAFLDAIFVELAGSEFEPVMLFRDVGPWTEQLSAAGVRCYSDPLPVPDKRRPVKTGAAIYRIARIVKREKIDVVHCNEHEHFPLLRYVGRLTGVPVVAAVRFRINEGFADWAFRSPWTPAALQFTSRDQLEDSLPVLPPNVTPDRVHLVMNGLSIDRFLARGGGYRELRDRWLQGRASCVIGTASVIRRRKRLEDFVMLIKRLKAEGVDVMGVIAGGGKFADEGYPEELEGLIRVEGLERDCLMLGNLDPITPFMQAIDVFVSTSEMETFGMSVCEAMACGKPAVAYDAGSLREVVADEWCLVPIGDLDGLSTKVGQLCDDPTLRHSLGQKGEAFVKANFDAPILAKRQVAIYEQILGRRLISRPTGRVLDADRDLS